MILILAPNRLFSTVGNTPVSAPRPAAPATNSLLSKSLQVLTVAVCQPTQTLTSLPTLPSQVNLRPSNFAALFPISGSSANAAIEVADGRAVFRRGVVEKIRRRQAAGTRPVHRDDCRIARNVLAEMAGDGAAIGVIGVGDRETDEELDRGLPVEFLNALRLRGRAVSAAATDSNAVVARRLAVDCERPVASSSPKDLPGGCDRIAPDCLGQ